MEREISLSELLERVIEKASARLAELNSEYSDFLNDLTMVDPPLWFEVRKLVVETICEEIFGDDEERVDDCTSDLYHAINKLENKYNESFLETWVEIRFSINKKIFEKAIKEVLSNEHNQEGDN